ncbi:DUF2975 domain-containing protein [Microbacterium caowuchunii]|uniref:DUF2975 domain-containing protein n=1 Tax=Microbacterium caowuchunii TaxID=2614638 RepID=A0A5N0TNJ2_9MICO|nr:DUF2975 domain-containing protein [Microbacterium caowuchunii]KAA9135838.1 DUF2975 domain-containing protein [Microbacterium caowuchunii]
MTRVTIILLRTLTVLLAAGALFAQVRLVPIIAAGLADDADRPEWAAPLAVAGILTIACGETVLVALWILLSQVRRGSIFTPRAFGWVDTMIAAGVVATALALAVTTLVALVLEPPLDAPGLVVMAGGLVVLSATFVLLMVVMRGLLRTATAMQAELAEVV